MIDHNLLSQQGLINYAAECLETDIRVRIYASLQDYLDQKEPFRVSVCDTGGRWKHQGKESVVYAVRTDVCASGFTKVIDSQVGPWTHDPIYFFIHNLNEVFWLSPYHGKLRLDSMTPNKCIHMRYSFINHEELFKRGALWLDGNPYPTDYKWTDAEDADREPWWVDQSKNSVKSRGV